MNWTPQEADVLSRSSVLPRPRRPRQGRASSRPNSLIIIVSAAKIACHRPPRRHTRTVRDPKISIGRAQPNGHPFLSAVSSLRGFRTPAPPYLTTRLRQGPASETLQQSCRCEGPGQTLQWGGAGPSGGIYAKRFGPSVPADGSYSHIVCGCANSRGDNAGGAIRSPRVLRAAR